MQFFYIGADQAVTELAIKLGVEVTVTKELTIDEAKSWEDKHEMLLREMYQQDGEEMYSVDEATVNSKLGYVVITQVHHPYPFKGVTEGDNHLYPDCQDKFWRELKYYVVLN